MSKMPKSLPSSPIRLIVAVTSLVLALGALPAAALDVVYLVRHAEKTEPWPSEHSVFQPLSDAGRARSEMLAKQLSDRGIAQVYASHTGRSLATGMPLAQASDIPIEADDATIAEAELPAFVADLRERHADDPAILIVGHSNTIPMVLRAFGAEPGCYEKLGIGEDDLIEGYDGLWHIDLTKAGCAGLERRSQAAEPNHP